MGGGEKGVAVWVGRRMVVVIVGLRCWVDRRMEVVWVVVGRTKTVLETRKLLMKSVRNARRPPDVLMRCGFSQTSGLRSRSQSFLVSLINDVVPGSSARKFPAI